MAQRATNDPEYKAFKRYLASVHVDCWYGCGRRATSPDHQPRLMEHTHVRGAGCCRLLPACRTCNTSDGATAGNSARRPRSGWA
jgi:hypothetical protein